VRVWVVNQFAVPPTQSGGTRHFALAKEMRKLGVETSIIAADVNYHSGKSGVLAEGARYSLAEHEGVEFLWLRSVSSHSESVVKRVIGMFDFWGRIVFGRTVQRLSAPDVIVGSSPQPFAAFAAALLAKRLKVPFVLEVRDMWPDSLIELGGYSRFHPFILMLSKLEKWLYRNADRIVVLLEGAQSEIVRTAAPVDVVTEWIPNGVDLSLFPAPSPSDNGASFVVLYAGAHGLANGLDTFLDAARLSLEADSDITFRLVGDGPRKAGLEKRAQDEGLTNVEFRESVAKSGVAGELAQADAFYMPLKNSPVFRLGISPNKLFDYMAAARPIIFAVNTERDPVREARAGLSIEPEDAEALAESVQRLKGLTPTARNEMGMNARLYAETNHSHTLLAQKFFNMLECVIQAKRPDQAQAQRDDVEKEPAA
jgi:glycosyltransferase involved in cell wall biosynthesis